MSSGNTFLKILIAHNFCSVNESLRGTSSSSMIVKSLLSGLTYDIIMWSYSKCSLPDLVTVRFRKVTTCVLIHNSY